MAHTINEWGCEQFFVLQDTTQILQINSHLNAGELNEPLMLKSLQIVKLRIYYSHTVYTL